MPGGNSVCAEIYHGCDVIIIPLISASLLEKHWHKQSLQNRPDGKIFNVNGTLLYCVCNISKGDRFYYFLFAFLDQV